MEIYLFLAIITNLEKHNSVIAECIPRFFFFTLLTNNFNASFFSLRND